MLTWFGEITRTWIGLKSFHMQNSITYPPLCITVFCCAEQHDLVILIGMHSLLVEDL